MRYTYSCVRNPQAKTWTKFYGCHGVGVCVLVSISYNGRVVIDNSTMFVDLKNRNPACTKKRFDNAYQIATSRIQQILSPQ
ncbi:MAG TPA: hypothetical protein VGN64_17000 [Dyadobacter sp.]|jgi:hypothetical protein|nr:hypothetical protein [Dyadobacter sp.]